MSCAGRTLRRASSLHRSDLQYPTQVCLTRALLMHAQRARRRGRGSALLAAGQKGGVEGWGGGVPDLFGLCVQQWLETVTRTCGRVFPSFSICVFPTSLKGYNPDKGAGQKFTHSHTLRSLCFTYNMNFSKRNAIKYLYSQPENISQHTRWFI